MDTASVGTATSSVIRSFPNDVPFPQPLLPYTPGNRRPMMDAIAETRATIAESI